MKSLRHRFTQYTGLLREWKGTYVINNLLNWEKLIFNRSLYKKYGIRKSIFAPIGYKDFPENKTEIPWLDQPNALEKLKQNEAFQTFSATEQKAIEQFVEDGYLVLEGFFGEEDVEKLNVEIDGLLQEQAIKFNYSGRKIMDAHLHAEVADTVFFRNARLLKLLQFIMGKKIIPFQTINFVEGSEQRAHSDSIHMTTYPQGYLIAAWIALEDIQEGTGELFYYPGSHRLPFVSTEDYPSGNSRYLIGKESNKLYEDRIGALVVEKKLKKEVFMAKKGDILLWHANLLHGGSPISKAGASRKSMVAHYFCEDVICYHEMTQRPAILR